MKQSFCVFALILLVSASVTLAQNPNNAVKDTRYLALGDSIPFGYNPTVPVNLNNYHGYPEFVSHGIHRKVANASCFGETSGSFLSPTAPDFGCRQWKQAGKPLFIRYSGTQMNYAINYLLNNPNPEFVTINIGGNDLAVLQQNCNFDLTCELNGLPTVFATYSQNMLTIFSNIRVQAKYDGPIVLLTYYAFNYTDPVLVRRVYGTERDSIRNRNFIRSKDRRRFYGLPNRHHTLRRRFVQGRLVSKALRRHL